MSRLSTPEAAKYLNVSLSIFKNWRSRQHSSKLARLVHKLEADQPGSRRQGQTYSIEDLDRIIKESEENPLRCKKPTCNKPISGKQGRLYCSSNCQVSDYIRVHGRGQKPKATVLTGSTRNSYTKQTIQEIDPEHKAHKFNVIGSPCDCGKGTINAWGICDFCRKKHK